MPQYYNNNNYYSNQNNQTTSCNTANCSRCRNKQGCYKYLSYLENIVNSTVAPLPSPIQQNVSQPIQSVQPTESNSNVNYTNQDLNTNIEQSSEQAVTLIQPTTVDIDLTSVIQSNSELKDSMIETVTNKFLILESNYKILQEINEGLVNTLSGMNDSIFTTKDSVSKLDDKLSKLDSFIEMVEVANARNGTGEQTENGLTVYNAEVDDSDVLVQTKGFFGLGKKWVPKDELDKKAHKKSEDISE